MGMDVFGRKPSSERGRYFRNSIGWWAGLWEFCEDVAPDITQKVKHGYSNDGDGLNARDSLALAHRLTVALKQGFAEQWQAERKAYYADPTVGNQPCQLCFGTGTLTIRSQEFSATGGEGDGDGDGEGGLTPPPLKESTFECGHCSGTGYARPLNADVPFDTENVREFIAFLKDCGGFSIW